MHVNIICLIYDEYKRTATIGIKFITVGGINGSTDVEFQMQKIQISYRITWQLSLRILGEHCAAIYKSEQG